MSRRRSRKGDYKYDNLGYSRPLLSYTKDRRYDIKYFNPVFARPDKPLPGLRVYSLPRRALGVSRQDLPVVREYGFPHREYLRNIVTHKFCVDRRKRKSVLFAMRIAGKYRRSPGRGGTYKRKFESSFSC